MKITQAVLDELTAAAEALPRLRMNLDLRNSPADGSQRMLNAIEPGRVCWLFIGIQALRKPWFVSVAILRSFSMTRKGV